jgi:hypothetical protein
MGRAPHAGPAHRSAVARAVFVAALLSVVLASSAPGASHASHDCAGLRRRVVPQAAFALVAYMSTYSWPESRMTSVITESVTARST